jgi:hypothetical protein
MVLYEVHDKMRKEGVICGERTEVEETAGNRAYSAI